MRFGMQWRVEYSRGFGVQELGVFGIGDEPAELRRKRLNQEDVRHQPVEEFRLRRTVVARLGRVRNEIAALEAFLQGQDMRGDRRADGENEEQQGEPPGA